MPAPHSLAFKLRKARFHLLIVEPQLCCDVSNHNVAPNKNLNRQKAVSIFGRSDGIRTHDLYVPNVALYQAELHSEKTNLFYILFLILQCNFYIVKQTTRFIVHWNKSTCAVLSGIKPNIFT